MVSAVELAIDFQEAKEHESSPLLSLHLGKKLEQRSKSGTWNLNLSVHHSYSA
jgi:hypothetical protein